MTGKSTLFQSLDSLKNIPRVNTDEIVRTFGSWKKDLDVFKAGKIAVNLIKKYFKAGQSFNQETTLCGRSILNNIEYAKAHGYFIELHYVGVDSVELAKTRIAYRVTHGGHDVAAEDVDRRYIESLNRLKDVLPKCDLAVLYDNTISFRKVAVYKDGKADELYEPVPNWCRSLFF